MSKRRRSEPTPEDLALWEKVAKDVAPLARRPAQAVSHAPPKPSADKKTKPELKPARTTMPPPAAAPKPRPRPEAPRLAPLDRRTRARVVKGTVSIDARLDLHGLTQSAAHARMRRFLADCHEARAKLVLVITGKGRPDESGSIGEERGVLKRMVPGWLGSAELRPYVIGFEAAGRGHGGDGALYVRIRSRRNAAS
jgi:DNA-nicking Smr family endonuclease